MVWSSRSPKVASAVRLSKGCGKTQLHVSKYIKNYLHVTSWEMQSKEDEKMNKKTRSLILSYCLSHSLLKNLFFHIVSSLFSIKLKVYSQEAFKFTIFLGDFSCDFCPIIMYLAHQANFLEQTLCLLWRSSKKTLVKSYMVTPAQQGT